MLGLGILSSPLTFWTEGKKEDMVITNYEGESEAKWFYEGKPEGAYGEMFVFLPSYNRELTKKNTCVFFLKNVFKSVFFCQVVNWFGWGYKQKETDYALLFSMWWAPQLELSMGQSVEKLRGKPGESVP